VTPTFDLPHPECAATAAEGGATALDDLLCEPEFGEPEFGEPESGE
jgi:hypothetical protein